MGPKFPPHVGRSAKKIDSSSVHILRSPWLGQVVTNQEVLLFATSYGILNDFDFLSELLEQTLDRNRDTEKQKTFLPFHSMWPNLPFLILRRDRGKEHFSLPSFPTNYTTLAILYYCSISV